jgi:hypothetical protein
MLDPVDPRGLPPDLCAGWALVQCDWGLRQGEPPARWIASWLTGGPAAIGAIMARLGRLGRRVARGATEPRSARGR